MFGGRDSRPQNDLWSYSIDAGQWTQLRPSGTLPAARFGHTLLFDAERHRLLVFGGQASGFFSDIWAYDVARNTWQQIAPGGSGPNERYGHSAILDASRDRLIISHGFTGEGRFDDTWALDLATNRWRDISPSSGRPLRRCLHQAVLDAEGNQMLLYGGCASGFGPCPLGDLWSFDLTTHRWTERTAGIKPPERQWYGMGFDTARRRLILFAGSGASGNLNDTWEYDPARGVWVQMRFTPAPAPRSRHEAVFAAGLGVVFFGGSAAEGLSNQLLAISANAVTNPPRFSSAAVVNAFSGNTGPLSPGASISIYGENLGPSFGTAATPDPEGNLPKSIAGAGVTFNGLRAPLFYAQSGQLNAQVPTSSPEPTKPNYTSNATAAQLAHSAPPSQQERSLPAKFSPPPWRPSRFVSAESLRQSNSRATRPTPPECSQSTRVYPKASASAKDASTPHSASARPKPPPPSCFPDNPFWGAGALARGRPPARPPRVP